jgi:hypothetical protein
LSASLLGDADAGDAAVTDMLRELANTAGGAFKRTAMPENAVVTTGLPTDHVLIAAPGATTRTWELTSADGLCIGIVAEMLALANVQVQAAELREGMVLAGDVHNRAGMLVVPGGTRLTATSAERVASILGATLEDVARAA